MAMGIKGKFAFVRGDGALIGVVREWRGRGFFTSPGALHRRIAAEFDSPVNALGTRLPQKAKALKGRNSLPQSCDRFFPWTSVPPLQDGVLGWALPRAAARGLCYLIPRPCRLKPFLWRPAMVSPKRLAGDRRPGHGGAADLVRRRAIAAGENHNSLAWLRNPVSCV